MNELLKISQYFAMLDALLHIGNQAVAAVAAADPSSTALAKVSAHLNAFSNTVDALEPTLLNTAQAVVTAIKPPVV